MNAYVLKHEDKNNLIPFTTLIESFKKAGKPYYLTDKDTESTKAALGCSIYVIEVTTENKRKIYKLGYKFKSTEKTNNDGEHKQYKITVLSGEPIEGCYFEAPVLITNNELDSWIRTPSAQGLRILSDENLVNELEKIISANVAIQFTNAP
ncbi:hypothetical protein [Methylovulum miyakonense]|uniref:hypothetical protein n=1 Tax=Methylovulum miyakonense TaxID=645578 RepID=UPI0012EBD689|nr:hypothetical protein [Methylovulum miyakonense]